MNFKQIISLVLTLIILSTVVCIPYTAATEKMPDLLIGDADGDGVKLEWNEQAAAIEGFVVGKDAAAISAMTYTDGKNADLTAVDATIKVESIMKAVAEAVSYSTKEVITAKPNA